MLYPGFFTNSPIGFIPMSVVIQFFKVGYIAVLPKTSNFADVIDPIPNSNNEENFFLIKLILRVLSTKHIGQFLKTFRSKKVKL